ncbi:MAG: universal stress protein [Acidobacteria bacterium]|nr:universal stress protein [Acidobacteriota bacterium]
MHTMNLQTKTTFERIMLATDFSRASEAAQTYAVGLARHEASTLEVANVIDLSDTAATMDALSEAALEALRYYSDEHLKQALEHTSGVRVTRKVIEGFDPASLIVGEAACSNADLIVLGTTAKRAFKKLVLGSTAEAVIRTAPCPVLTVGPHAAHHANGPLSFQRIVYATDFSSQAKKAADLALSLGQTNGATVYLCHVITEDEAANVVDCDARSIASLEALVPETVNDWCHAACVVEHGKASEAILALAKRVDADLIVLGARKATFWIEYVHAGLTPALLADATCPVLTVC